MELTAKEQHTLVMWKMLPFQPVSIVLFKQSILGLSFNLLNCIKVNVQPCLGNNGSNFGWNLYYQTSYIYKSAGRWADGQTRARSGGPTSHLTIVIKKWKKNVKISCDGWQIITQETLSFMYIHQDFIRVNNTIF